MNLNILMDEQNNRPMNEILKEKILSLTGIEIGEAFDFDISNCGVGGKIWKSAVVLSSFIKNNKEYSDLFRNKVVLELGAGTGVVGIVASLLNIKKVIISDRDQGTLEVIMKNIQLNKEKIPLRLIEVVPLEWGNKEHFLSITEKVDLIIGSDLLYSLFMVESLITTVEYFAHKDLILVLAFAKRGEEVDLFYKKIGETWELNFLPDDQLTEKFYGISIVILKKK